MSTLMYLSHFILAHAIKELVSRELCLGIATYNTKYSHSATDNSLVMERKTLG